MASIAGHYCPAPLDLRTIISDTPVNEQARPIPERVARGSAGQFLIALGLSFRVDYLRGKGSHATVYVGNDKRTTVPDRDIDPVTAKKIRKVLGLL